jgi:hypothetical protein
MSYDLASKPDFTIKQGDTLPALDMWFSDGKGAPIDLTDASVRLVITKPNWEVLLDKPCAVLDAKEGYAQYCWQEGDTDTPGIYWAEFKIIWPLGLRLTVPHVHYLRFEIVRKLGEGG